MTLIVGNAGGAHPNGDETTNSDGWAAFSGTSAAAPQLAGVAALIKQACPGLTPVQVRNIMKNTARDVTAGNSNSVQGTPIFPAAYAAGAGVDIATGHGLVDAHKAVMVAKVTCLGPIQPPIIAPPIVGPPIVAPPIIGPPIRSATDCDAPGYATRPAAYTASYCRATDSTGPIAPIVNPGPAQPKPAADERRRWRCQALSRLRTSRR